MFRALYDSIRQFYPWGISKLEIEGESAVAYILLVCQACCHHHEGDRSEEVHLGVRHRLHLEMCHEERYDDYFKKVFTHLGDGIMPTETSPYRESAPPISLTLNK